MFTPYVAAVASRADVTVNTAYPVAAGSSVRFAGDTRPDQFAGRVRASANVLAPQESES
jgi:hypothetical protein